MNTQHPRVAHSKGRDDNQYSFFEAQKNSGSKPSAPTSSRELQPPAGAAAHKSLPATKATPNQVKIAQRPTTIAATSHASNASNYSAPSSASAQAQAQAPAPTSNPGAKMASPRAQSQCLELCYKTTALGDRISIHVLEYLTSSKHLQPGFDALAHDFLDICQILFAIEAGLGDCNRTGQKFPPELITELDHKFRVTQTDFQILDQMLGKFLGHSSRMKRGWGKLFGDTDIRKMSQSLGKTRDSLKMSSLVFQWNLGSEKVQREAGIGYTALAAALDRMDHKPGEDYNRSASSTSPNIPQQPHQQPHQQPQHQHHSHSGHSEMAEPHHEMTDGLTNLNLYQQHQQGGYNSHYEPSVGGRSSSYQHGGRRPHSPDHPQPLGLDFRYTTGGPTALPTPSTTSFDRHYTGNNDMYERASTIDDSHSIAATNDYEAIIEDVSGQELGPTKVVRVTADPSTMPRSHPRSTGEDTNGMKSTLISAVRSKNHKLVDQLLNRGCSPNTGPHIHSLKEAIINHDQETVRLLLLFGADPNEPDREGVTPLLVAVEKGFATGATLLLKYGADPNLLAGPESESPLASAVMANHVGMSHLLLTYNGDVAHLNSNGSTLLICAVKKKTPKKFIDLLLAYGCDPNVKSRDGKTVLFEAITAFRADIVTSLLEAGADPNMPGPKHPLWPSNYHAPCLEVMLTHGADPKKTPGMMELAASLNNIESVRVLLKFKVDPNMRKDGIYTPLCTSIRDDRPELFDLLLANGADPNVPASEYPAFKCITHKRLKYLPLLLKAGVDLNSPKGILETAVSFNNMEALTWLLDQGVNPNDKTPKGMSPLTTAIREDHVEMVDLLLARGADPHVRGEDWPLCMSVRKPHILKHLLTVINEPSAFKGVVEMAVHADELESVKLLLAAGVSVEDKNGGVFSPLTTALRENHRQIVRYLISDGGADVNAPGEHLPVVKALRRFHGEDTEMLELLLANGADPNKMYRGWNAIFQGIENGDADILRMLVSKNGVDLDARDERGVSVVEMAASRGWNEAVKILTDGGVSLKR
ncbi:Ankyrin-3-like protein 5 [Phlyctema vagabunda]|uniref:Ankyrin-3-like protein 5 n=1 Tax=Phlyctema vagabunda TaxID=108571 RepID=A0ABR4PH16_9HELO